LLVAPWLERADKTPAAGPEGLMFERNGRIVRVRMPPDMAAQGAGPGDRDVSAP
jgi:hypothetical protein